MNSRAIKNKPFVGSFYEFFAGGGMVRAGLGSKWSCLFSNDFDLKKAQTYHINWGSHGSRIEDTIRVEDIRQLKPDDLPALADLAWASFPCQDLSLAGGGAGLKGDRSGTFWPFWRLMTSLQASGRSPAVIALENVCGTLTSHQGKDFSEICQAFHQAGYRCGALVIDAVLFVPQSRPRLFVIGVRQDLDIPDTLIAEAPSPVWHIRGVQTAFNRLSPKLKANWVWWNLPVPPPRTVCFADLIEANPQNISWHSKSETERLLNMMSELNRAKVEDAKRSGSRKVGTVYKRTRLDENGYKVQRAEIRFDDVAGCLRTPAGGSSRQLIMVIEGNKIKSRLLSNREAARLMGLPDDYVLPERYNEAYHLTGDGVVVPVIQHLSQHILEPLILSHSQLLQEVA